MRPVVEWSRPAGNSAAEVPKVIVVLAKDPFGNNLHIWLAGCGRAAALQMHNLSPNGP